MHCENAKNDHIGRKVSIYNYYRKFIKEFSVIMLPLTELTRNEVEYNFDNDCRNVFENLKKVMDIWYLLLRYRDWSKEFRDCI